MTAEHSTIDTLQLLVGLLIVVSVVAFLANRLKVPHAILLVITGVALALVPGLPALELAPEFVLMIILPPVIYSSAVAMSWREFRFNLRPISLLAVGCVVFTTLAAAAATHWLLGFPWAVGFVLGAIISPPDAVAPLSVARRMQLPRRLLVILEGEGLANDATALILYRFAVAAVSLGVFSLGQAAEDVCRDRRRARSCVGSWSLGGSCSGCGAGLPIRASRSRCRFSRRSWRTGRRSTLAGRGCSRR